ncbi:MAG TPA: BON domain-containing protein [Cellvibrionaceae bacterium]
MKEINSSIVKVATAILIASTSTSSLADNESAQTQHKKEAGEYWQEFKQDSEQAWDTSKDAFRDGWIEGKLHTAIALNKNLKPFEIAINVDDSTASLSGDVSSSIDKELAEQIALGIEGIDHVNNQIQVNPDYTGKGEDDERRDILQYMSDISTTAAIKTEILASNNINGLSIDVDTYRDTVTLSGKAETEAEKDLAEVIASKRQSVTHVINNIETQ